MEDQKHGNIGFLEGLKMLWTMAVMKGREGLAKQTFGFVLLLFVAIGLVFTIKMVISFYDTRLTKVEKKVDSMERSSEKSKREITELLRHELRTSSMVIQKNNELYQRIINEFEK